MIVGKISDAKRYYSLNENFKAAFEFLEALKEGLIKNLDSSLS